MPTATDSYPPFPNLSRLASLSTALNVHLDGIGEQALTLRLYEGCARAALGVVAGAAIMKLRRDEPKVSYLCDPAFERDPHPELAESASVHLQTFRMRTRRYAASAVSPVLHRKETFISPGHPLRGRSRGSPPPGSAPGCPTTRHGSARATVGVRHWP